MKFGLLFFAIAFIISATSAQHICNIDIKISGYQKDSIVLGYFDEGKMNLMDTIVNSADGKFKIQRKTNLPIGMYFIQMIPDNRYFEFIAPEEQVFSITTDMTKLFDALSVTGSIENELFFNILRIENFHKKEAEELNTKFRMLNKRDPIEAKKTLRQLNMLNNNVIQEQSYAVKDHPNSIVYKYINVSKVPETPEYDLEDTIAVKNAEYYVKQHFFDNINFADQSLQRSPYPYNQIKSFLRDNATQADSLNKVVDIVMSKLGSNPNLLKHYGPFIFTILNDNKTSVLEASYVSFVLKYIGNPNCVWLTTDQKTTLIEDAKRRELLLIGSKAPDFKLKDAQGKIINLYQSDSLLTILFFSDPTEASSRTLYEGLVGFYENYQFKSVNLLNICAFKEDDCTKCYKYAAANLIKFTVLADCDAVEKVKKAFNISRTPALIVLDKDKKILAKDINIPQLFRIVHDYLKQ